MSAIVKADDTELLLQASVETLAACEDADAVLEHVRAYRLESAHEYEAAGRVLPDIKEAIGRLKERREYFTGDLKRAVQKLDEAFKRPIAQYEAAEKFIKQRMADYRERERQRVLALEAKAQAAAEAGDVKAARALILASDAEIPQVAGVSFAVRYKARVVNAALVPREYLTPDQAALDRVARESKGRASIPGVEFDRIEDVRSSTGGKS